MSGHEVDLEIGGMTCASCAARVEKKLNRMAGVVATVNYATEKAHVSYADAVTPDDLVATVEQTGYTAALPAAADDDAGDAGDGVDEAAGLRRRLVVSAVLAVPVVLMSMLQGLEVDGWEWLSLALATPVVTWGAWPFHRAALTALRHGSSTMDTLVSLGVTGRPTAGRSTRSCRGGGEIYLEVAAGVTVFLLLGRYLEARARRRSGAALRALLSLGAKDVAVLRDGVEVRVPVAALVVGEEFVVRPGEKVATDGEVVRGDLGRRRLDAHG